LAHSPSEEAFDHNFGSLQKYSEIWSICTNPQAYNSPDPLSYIVTSSEDQTVKVFKFDSKSVKLERVQTLKGHTLAVTSIDWQKDTLITCSDDKSIRIYHFNEAASDSKGAIQES